MANITKVVNASDCYNFLVRLISNYIGSSNIYVSFILTYLTNLKI